jgi:hypothetical protein
VRTMHLVTAFTEYDELLYILSPRVAATVHTKDAGEGGGGVSMWSMIAGLE